MSHPWLLLLLIPPVLGPSHPPGLSLLRLSFPRQCPGPLGRGATPLPSSRRHRPLPGCQPHPATSPQSTTTQPCCISRPIAQPPPRRTPAAKVAPFLTATDTPGHVAVSESYIPATLNRYTRTQPLGPLTGFGQESDQAVVEGLAVQSQSLPSTVAGGESRPHPSSGAKAMARQAVLRACRT